MLLNIFFTPNAIAIPSYIPISSPCIKQFFFRQLMTTLYLPLLFKICFPGSESGVPVVILSQSFVSLKNFLPTAKQRSDQILRQS